MHTLLTEGYSTRHGEQRSGDTQLAQSVVSYTRRLHDHDADWTGGSERVGCGGCVGGRRLQLPRLWLLGKIKSHVVALVLLQ